MPLSKIHTSGDVPQYKEKLEKGMLNMFKRLQPDKPVLRNNYFIQVDHNLAWSESLGSEDEDGINWASAEKIEGVDNVWFRSERQSLRRYVERVALPVQCTDEVQASTLRGYCVYNPDLLPPHHRDLQGAIRTRQACKCNA